MILKVERLVQFFAFCSIFSTSTVENDEGNLEHPIESETISQDSTLNTEFDSVKVHDNIIKGALDDREYRHLTLPNDLQCLLISDERSHFAAAALDINVGSTSNPFDLEGLAHFLEHLLFMGNTKYPDESEYMKFLNNHGGFGNAYTCAEHTYYHFEVPVKHLEQSLDRFSQFFVSPLFLESCVERELNAVDSEHSKI